MRWPWQKSPNDDAPVVCLDGSRRSLATLSERPSFALPDGPPEEMRLLAAGVNRTQKGDFVFDEQAAKDVMSFWAENGVDLTFDYEHQALQDPPVKALASCWRWVPEVRNGELWATGMRWTDEAAAEITKKQYRYWSPALLFNKETMRVEAILNCALTNLPATKNIAPLLAASAATKEIDMATCESCTSLSAKLSAKEAECAQLTAKLSAMDDTEKAECTAVGLSAGTRPLERLAVIQSAAKLRTDIRTLTGQDSDAGALGMLSAWKDSSAEVAKLKAAAVENETAVLTAQLNAVLDEGTKDGKVAPSEDHTDRKFLRQAVLGYGAGKLTADGIAQLKGYVAGMPVKAPSARAQLKAPSDGLLTENQKRIAKLAGMSVKDRATFAERETSGS